MFGFSIEIKIDRERPQKFNLISGAIRIHSKFFVLITHTIN